MWCQDFRPSHPPPESTLAADWIILNLRGDLLFRSDEIAYVLLNGTLC